ncbi:murein biosynthesis integral membrane protein MurJ [Candidatus Kuenenbacteria bacterium RIFCSPLOWO2_12_FULL_42_13]|uniref:Probable lipid II flippase MurJ n=2 Tax=Candidatus Kueneniibacteriota TaxID=1752740 RepID=A0A1F6G1K5_9BACT|nr:MAG: murein biosynthesis integral membrane protein MurJ [Candidatus Kuenenbacteria bacterium RIFCSPLOWO2_02_FULL_42_16]OGG91980.1 MAG: murein biosynthesis integral membrane protein MurJ [Candidatus Kuenenbacteria bacterium RIFCSPLOWO2_12_FULL_42_13]
MKRLNNIFKKLNNSTTGGAIVIAAFSILSKILGLLRDRLLAAKFGAGDVLDAYFAAFRLPDLIFNTLILGALSAAFIPVFIELKSKHGQKNGYGNMIATLPVEQLDDEIGLSAGVTVKTDEIANGNDFNHWDLSSAVLNIVSLIMVVFGAGVCIFAPQLVALITPGFTGEKMTLTIKLTRIMLLSIVFFGVSNVFSGILQSLKKFTVFALAPVAYNLGIIVGIIFLVDIWGEVGLGLGVVLGAFLHLMIQWPSVRRAGFRWRFILTLKNKAVRQIGKLMLPRTVGLAGNQISQLITTVIASGLLSGSLAIYNLAFNLGSVPISIFAVSLAIATFPGLSESFTQKNHENFRTQLSSAIRRILCLMIPISLFMIALRAQIVRLVLGAGSFNWEDTILTADSLGFFTISIFSQGLIPLLARAFYALQNTKMPVIISLIAVAINIVGAVILAPIMGVMGLALAFSISSIVNLVLLAAMLRHKLGYLDEKKIFISILKIVVATLGGLTFIQLTKYAIASIVDMRTFWGVLIQFGGAGGIGAIVFVIISLIVGSEEVGEIKKYIIKKRLKNF